MVIAKRSSLILLLSIAAFLVDRSLKQLALSGATFGPENGGVRFELLPNPAIAFSIAFPKTLSLIVIPFILVGFVYAGLVLYRKRHEYRAALLLAIVIAAGSNYLDRWQHGYVVDYMSFGNWFPVFNLSDLVILLFIVLFLVAARSGAEA